MCVYFVRWIINRCRVKIFLNVLKSKRHLSVFSHCRKYSFFIRWIELSSREHSKKVFLHLLYFMGRGIPNTMALKENQNFSDSMPNPLSVYVPFGALTQRVLKSAISVVCDRRGRYIVPGSERPLLCFLLAINKKLKELEKKEGKSNPHVQQVRQWLVDRKGKPLNWKELQDQFDHIYKPSNKDPDRYKLTEKPELYHEMSLIPVSH